MRNLSIENGISCDRRSLIIFIFYRESDVGRPDERRARGMRSEKSPACWVVHPSPVVGEMKPNNSFSRGAERVSAELFRWLRC